MLRPYSRRPWTGFITGFFVLSTLLAAIIFLGIPSLQRLRLRIGVSLFDSGVLGLYPVHEYVSTDLVSPKLEQVAWDPRCSNDLIFLSARGNAVEQPGPMIFNAQGELMWKLPPTSERLDNFQVQEYRGETFLTYWHGVGENGHGRGSWIMMDSTYTPRIEVRAVGMAEGDMHEFRITPNNTALVIVYTTQPADLSDLGGPQHGYIHDCLFQEIDIATGELIFEWRMSEHVPLTSSYEALLGNGWSPAHPYDVFHMNSVDKDEAGNYLVSARHTHSITSIDGRTGAVLWTLGGALNEFADVSNGSATDFAWQHHARWQDSQTITLLDNGAKWFFDEPTASRGLVLELDVPNRIATVKATYQTPTEQATGALSQGSMQLLPDTGNVFIGWGHCAAFTEFAPDGEVLCDTHFGAGNWFQLGQVMSYRTTRGHWIGRPRTRPDAVVRGSSVYVSWNGATEVARWQVQRWDGGNMGPQMDFTPEQTVPRDGFETEIPLTGEAGTAVYFRVVALDAQGQVLGVSQVMGQQPQGWGEQFASRYLDPMSSEVETTLVLVGGCLSWCVFLLWRWLVNRRWQRRGYKPLSLEMSDRYSTDDSQEVLG
ncbi:hypothetical protein ASPACDRAFT_1890035 [Aspergillus aculeatus ATCC 16872]|uniref:Uncharacterized protein n=1 Tax=Aspergillus aculeatus (strain ATCC 16872 / CBS 172.66 / WB 5094) TaxID=690307 RepID=A0A1L9WPU0_ASPA1|nr:uncharacterized protein ASPACDRAFT_1890035 [Aspergillus aculeatus ATCC 16872]OJJ98150.1 hypothetical protein ASPACDRAFT_1890035 [Aspergillus aculeatus ATCC 16872]